MVLDKAAAEDIQESDLDVIGNWKKGDACYIVVESTTWTPSVMLQVLTENIPDELDDLAKDISFFFFF